MKSNKEDIGCLASIIVAVLLFVALVVWIRLDDKKEAKFNTYKEEAKSYFEQKDYEKAIQIYLLSQEYANEEKANKTNIDIAVCYDSLSQYENVIKYYDFYLEHISDFDEVYFTKAYTHYKYKNYSRGIETFNDILKQHCTETDTYLISKGKEYLTKHKKDKAIDIFLKAIKVNFFKIYALEGVIRGYAFVGEEANLDTLFIKKNLTMDKDFYEACQFVLTEYYYDTKQYYDNKFKSADDVLSYFRKWGGTDQFPKMKIKELVSQTYNNKWYVGGILLETTSRKYAPNTTLNWVLNFWNNFDDKSEIFNKGEFINNVSKYISELSVDTIIKNKTTIAQIINKFKSPNISDATFDVLLSVGNYHYHSENLDKAETFYSNSLQDISTIKDDSDSTRIQKLQKIQFQLACVYYNKQNYLKAKDYYLKSRTICEQIKTQNPQYSINGIIFILSPLSYTYRRLNDYQTAISLSKERIELLQKNKDVISNYEVTLAEAFLECSYFYLYTNSYDLAEQYHKKAQAIKVSSVSLKINETILLLLQGRYSQIDFAYYNERREKANSYENLSKMLGNNQNNTTKQEINHYVQVVLMRLDELQKANVIPRERYADVEKIRKMLRD